MMFSLAKSRQPESKLPLWILDCGPLPLATRPRCIPPPPPLVRHPLCRFVPSLWPTRFSALEDITLENEYIHGRLPTTQILACDRSVYIS